MSSIYDVNGNEIIAEQEEPIVEPEMYDIPTLYFTGTLPTKKSDGKVKQTVRYVSNTTEFECYCTLKVQGESSTNYPKKNFNIQFFKDDALTKKNKLSFKTWGDQSKYTLKANWIDLSHARNVVSARIWNDIVKTRDYWASLPEELRLSPNSGAIDGFPVKVYSNDVYQGRYTLNIPKDKWMSNMDDSLDTHSMLYSENYESGCFRASAVIDGTDWTDEVHEDNVPASIITRWNQVISFVMTSSDSDFTSQLGNYFDIDSLVDYYIYAYVSTGLDSLGKNQMYFTYDGQLWIASFYDMDSTWGLYWDGTFVSATYRLHEDYEPAHHNTSNLLYDRVESLFADKIKSRYKELRKTVLSEGHLINRFKEFTSIASKELVAQDYASTTGGGNFTGIPSKESNNIVQIRENIIARLEYVDTMIAALE